MIQPRHPIRSTRGFTLTELLATIVVLAIMGSIASMIVLTATDGYFSATTRARLHNEASVALDRIVRELRKIEQHPDSENAVPHIDSMNANRLEWNGDHVLLHQNNALLLDAGVGTAHVLLGNVTSFQLDAFDSNNDPRPPVCNESNCEPIRRFAITLTVSDQGETVTLRTRVFIRSMMTGAKGGAS